MTDNQNYHHHSTMPSTAPTSSSARFVTDIITPLKDRVALLPGSRDRHNRPLIFFPTTDISANSDELKNILSYFYSVTADDAKPHGFIFIIGTKKGNSRQSVKPSTILQLINEYFPGKVVAVYIIVKGNNFFKMSSTSGKYKFHVQEITEENLTKSIDSSQLLKEFGGNLHYDHDEWIEIRKDIEIVIQKLGDCYKECENCYKMLHNKQKMEDVGQDWRMICQDEFEKKLHCISTIDCDNHIRRIHQHIVNPADDRFNANSLKTPNPDLAAVIPHLKALGKEIAKQRVDLTEKYQRSKLEQDQWNQFRLLENQVTELKTRILSQKALIDKNFTVIGNNENDALQLLKEHQRFDDEVEQTKVNYSRLLKHGSILITNFPAKKSEIDAILKDLENSWNYFTALIDQRHKLLDLVISFRQQTEIYFSNLPEWLNFIKSQPDNYDRPLAELEEILQKQEEVKEKMELSYSQSYNESNKLSLRLQMYLGQERAGKDESYLRVIDIVQKLIRSKRELHGLFDERRMKLTLKQGYLQFNAETLSVISWVNTLGLPFMRKKSSIGTSNVEAKKFLNLHQNFKNIAENTRKNAFQLYQVAEQLVEDETIDREVIQERLNEMSSVVQNFFNLMDQREALFTHSAIFHLHYEEIIGWYDKIKDRSLFYESVPQSNEDCERYQDQLIHEIEATSQAYSTVIEESNKLLKMLRIQKESLNVDIAKDEAHIEEMTNCIQTTHSKEMAGWPYQKNCVQIGNLARTFITDCVTASQQIMDWRRDLIELQQQHQDERTHYRILKHTNDNMNEVDEAARNFEHRHKELIQMIEANQLNLVDDITKEPITIVLNRNFNDLNKYIEDSLKRAANLKNELTINRDIRDTYHRTNEMIACFTKETTSVTNIMAELPKNKEGAKRNELEFQKLYNNYDAIYPSFNELREFFYFLAQNTAEKQRNEIKLKHDTLMNAWEAYVGKVKDCQRFVIQAVKFHSINEGLTPLINDIIQSREKQPIDYCSTSKIADLIKHLSSLQTKQANDKEKFIKMTIHSQRVYDDYIKVIQRCPMKREYRLLKETEIQKQMEVNERQQKEVLKIINNKKKGIEQCQRAVFIRMKAKDIQTWLNNDSNVRKFGDEYRRSLSSLSEDVLQERYNEFLEFKSETKKKHHEVKEFNRHADLYLREGINIVHSQEIQKYQHTVTECFKTVLKQIEDMHKQFQLLLGGTIERISPSDDSSVNDVTERFSDSTLEEKLQQTDDQKADNQMRRPMNELIQGEKDGIDYLRVIIDIYLPEYRRASNEGTLPPSMIGKEKEIFGNIEEIYQFHQHFVKELELYKNNPTDVGCAFVNNIQKIRDIYCKYTINKEQNGTIHHEQETVKFFTRILHAFSGNNNNSSHSNLDYYKEKKFNVNFDSVVMWPVQRLFKYTLLLEALIKNAPYEITEIKEVKDDIEGISSYANGIVKLSEIEGFTLTANDVFCMAEEFIVTEPKRFYKREKEYQVFLFETSILLTKKEKNEKNAVKYIFKDQIMLNDVFVVEHVDSSNSKFGLRKRNSAGNVSSTDNTIIFKALNERNQKPWIKKLREFTVSIQHNQDPSISSKKSSTATLSSGDNYRQSFRSSHSYNSSRPPSSTDPTSSNRNSRSSRDSYEFSPANGHPKIPENNGDSSSSAKDTHVGFRLSQWPKD